MKVFCGRDQSIVFRFCRCLCGRELFLRLLRCSFPLRIRACLCKAVNSCRFIDCIGVSLLRIGKVLLCKFQRGSFLAGMHSCGLDHLIVIQKRSGRFLKPGLCRFISSFRIGKLRFCRSDQRCRFQHFIVQPVAFDLPGTETFLFGAGRGSGIRSSGCRSPDASGSVHPCSPGLRTFCLDLCKRICFLCLHRSDSGAF